MVGTPVYNPVGRHRLVKLGHIASTN